MSGTFRPSDHEQRSTCLRAADDLVAMMSPCGKGLPNAVSNNLTDLFIPIRDQYILARRDYRRAVAAREAANLVVVDTDKLFDRTGRTWNKSVQDIRGCNVPQELAKPMHGVRPGQLFGLAPRREVDLAAGLFEQLPTLPHLQGDTAKLAAFMAAHASLTEAVKVLEAAERTHRDSKETFDAATRKFDRKWVNLVEILEEATPEVAAKILPTFPAPKPKPPSKAKPRSKKAKGLPVLPPAEPGIPEVTPVVEVAPAPAPAPTPTPTPAETALVVVPTDADPLT